MGSYFGNKFLLYISFLFISYLHWKVGLTQNLLLSSLFDLILNMSNSSVSFSPISSIAIPKHNIRVFVNQNYLQNASFSLLLFSILLYNSTHFIFFFFFHVFTIYRDPSKDHKSEDHCSSIVRTNFWHFLKNAFG